MTSVQEKPETVDVHTVELSAGLIDELARPLVDILRDFYDDPANEAAFAEWQRARRGTA